MSEWLKLARRPDVVRRARRVALIVGTPLPIMSYGDRVLARDLRTPDPVKMALPCLVLYGVSIWSAVQEIREGEAAPGPSSVRGDGSAPPGSSGSRATSPPP